MAGCAGATGWPDGLVSRLTLETGASLGSTVAATAHIWWNTCAVESKHHHRVAVSTLIGAISGRMHWLGYFAPVAWDRRLVITLIRGSVTSLTPAQKSDSITVTVEVCPQQ